VAELAGPAVISSGHTLRHGLLLRNLTSRELQIATNGQVTADVIDPHTGEVVGGFAGVQHLPLIIFRVAESFTTTVAIPGRDPDPSRGLAAYRPLRPEHG
jgi:hypothetical protein